MGVASAALIAWDPAHRREVWRVPQPGAWPAGTLVTQGGLVFAGNAAGKFVAYEAGSGRKLWEFAALRGIVAAPISYRA
ncbi:outer membrane protein assembly factor BamB family protein, partial [Vibrio parahaemolyticus]